MIRDMAYTPTRDLAYYASKSWITEWKKAIPQELTVDINKKIKCTHGNLSTNEMSWQKISTTLWDYLKGEYPESTEIPIGTQQCAICIEEKRKKQQEVDEIRAERLKEQVKFSEVLKRQVFSKLAPGTYNLIPLSWVTSWKHFLTNGKQDQPGPINNSVFLSESGNLQYDPETESGVFYAVYNKDWLGLQAIYGNTPEIIIEKNEYKSKEGSLVTYKTKPPVSQEDINTRKNKESLEALNFNNDYVSVIKKEDTPIGIRRSERIINNSSIKIYTSARTSIEMFKLQIFEAFNVPPLLQKLFFQETVLDDDTKTLLAYGVQAHNTVTMLVLDVDSVSDFDVQSSVYSSIAPEEGFKGSTLQGVHMENDENGNDEQEENSEKNDIQDDIPPSGWYCNSCTFRNENMTATSCEVCNTPKNTNQWECSTCTFINDTSEAQCVVCSQK